MKSKWKLFIIVFIVTVVGLFAWTKVSDNLSTYSVYYARYTEGRYSPLQEAMRNFNQIEHPELDNYKYKRDNLSGDWEFTTAYNGAKIRYIVIADSRQLYYNDEAIHYSLTPLGQVEYIPVDTPLLTSLRHDISDEEQIFVDEALSTIFEPIIQAQPAPDWNLQWLYNLLNQKSSWSNT